MAILPGIISFTISMSAKTELGKCFVLYTEIIMTHTTTARINTKLEILMENSLNKKRKIQQIKFSFLSSIGFTN